VYKFPSSKSSIKASSTAGASTDAQSSPGQFAQEQQEKIGELIAKSLENKEPIRIKKGIRGYGFTLRAIKVSDTNYTHMKAGALQALFSFSLE
jgi:predicted ATP-binding protein involved in virulence